jgi:hypothetical protein
MISWACSVIVIGLGDIALFDLNGDEMIGGAGIQQEVTALVPSNTNRYLDSHYHNVSYPCFIRTDTQKALDFE